MKGFNFKEYINPTSVFIASILGYIAKDAGINLWVFLGTIFVMWNIDNVIQFFRGRKVEDSSIDDHDRYMEMMEKKAQDVLYICERYKKARESLEP